jgi:hypothetical protein
MDKQQNLMRIEIKTKTPVKDNDIKALYLIQEAMRISSPHMKEANLKLVAEKNGIWINKV